MSGLVGVIRVVTSADEDFLQSHARVLEARFGFPTMTRCIPDQPHGIHDGVTMAAAVPKIVRIAQDLVIRADVDLILISCAADRVAVSPCRGRHSRGRCRVGRGGRRLGER